MADALKTCPTCGVVAPTAMRHCRVCEGDLSSPREIPANHDGTFWVAIRAHFQCRSCGHLSPLNQLDMDGTVQCGHCGLEQAFDVDSWDEALAHAHATGDLAGPAPEGRHPHPRIALTGDNPMARLGVDQVQRDSTQTGTVERDGMVLSRSLRVDTGPGHPPCKACGEPLDHAHRDGKLSTRCSGCGATMACELPHGGAGRCEGLRGVLADDLRVDRPQVKLERSAGAIALACPGCGAALADAVEGKVVSCGFCNAVSLIPDRLLLRYLDRKPPSETWWLLFEGPSPLRGELEACVFEDKEQPAVAKADELPRPLFARVFTTVVIPLVILAVMGVLAYSDRLAGLVAPLAYRVFSAFNP
jgi:hypothetical protein